MAKINDAIKQVLASDSKSIAVATSSKDGLPNVVPFGFVKVYDEDTLLLADNFMDKSYKNLEENSKMSVALWDAKNRQSYQIKGTANIVKSGAVYDETVAWVQNAVPSMKPKSAVLLKVTKVFISQPGENLGKEL